MNFFEYGHHFQGVRLLDDSKKYLTDNFETALGWKERLSGIENELLWEQERILYLNDKSLNLEFKKEYFWSKIYYSKLFK
jgi:hypothetical protein